MLGKCRPNKCQGSDGGRWAEDTHSASPSTVGHGHPYRIQAALAPLQASRRTAALQPTSQRTR